MAKQLKDFLESFEFNRAALAKQRLSNLRHQGRKVRGARIANLMRAAGLKEEELDETELDQIDEVLSKDASAEDWIKDFVHSDAPQFQGKSKKERIKMALGAHYAKQRNEEVEIEESKDTVTKDASGKVTSWKHEGDWKKAPKQHKDQFGNTIKDKNVARHLARQGMQQAMKEEHGIDITDEDADTIVEGVLGALAGGTLAALATGPVGALAGAYLGHKVQQGANAKKKLADKTQKEEVELEEASTMDKIRAGNPAPARSKSDSPGFQAYLAAQRAKRAQAAQAKPTTPAKPAAVREEAEQIVEYEIHHDGKGNYRDDEGNEWSGKSGPQNSSFGRRKTVTSDVPHAVHINGKKWKSFGSQSHAQNVANKIKGATVHKEEVEIQEAQYAGLEKEDKPGKVKTAIVKTHEKAVGSETVEGWKDPAKPVKESYDEEGNLITMPKSFKEFMEGMTATKVAPNVTRYTGGSYGNAKGAKYGNTDYDKETLDTKDDEGAEQQKRGRGRPAGAKSGARGPRIK